MRHALSLILLLYCSNLLIAQTTFYSTGMGFDNNWLIPENWSLDPSGLPLATTAPTINDHVVIRDSIRQKVPAGYIHYGNVTIEREGVYDIFSGSGVSEPYIWAGDSFIVKGTLMTSSDFHHQIENSDGNGLLIFERFAIAEIGDDLILNAYGHTIMNNAACGNGGSFDDLYFKGLNATLCGNGRFVVPDAIRAWDENNSEVIPSSLQTRVERNGQFQICPEFQFFGSLEDCNNDVPPPTLPIELRSFTLEQRLYEIELSWSTVWELNNNFFTLERSVDGDEFEAMVDILGAGTTGQQQNYSYTDYQPISGRSYYRLKQTDFDGQFSYSQVLSANFQPKQAYLRIYPNPSSQSLLNIDAWGFPKDRVVPILIINLAGKVVYRNEQLIDTRGFGRHSINVSLPAGVYTLRSLARSGWISEKLLVN